MDPQLCQSDQDPTTSFMRPAPIPNDDETGLPETETVLDPLDDNLLNLWQETAATNSGVYHELWKPVPSNDVTSWAIFKDYVPKVKPGHLADESVR